MRLRFLFTCCVLLVLVFQTSPALAQVESASSSTQGLERIQVGQAGVQLYRPETWGMISTSIRNPQDQDVEVLMTSHTTDDPTLQYGQRLWVPAHARRVSWHPMLMPALTEADQKFFEIRTLLSNPQGESSSFVSNETGGLLFDYSIRVGAEEMVTLFIGPPGLEESLSGQASNPIDLVRTARYERALSKNLFAAGMMAAPPGEDLLDVVDHLVIASDRILEDSAALNAVRRWVVRGGSMWVMADQVSPEVLESLLGDEADFAMIDRVELPEVHVIPTSAAPTCAPFARSLDQPVPLVRMTGHGIHSLFVVDDWPAAFWINQGSGRILVTTLGSDGWIRPRLENDPPPLSGRHFQTRYVVSEPLATLAVQFFEPRPSPRFVASQAEDQVRQMVGYAIPSRGYVVGILTVFTILIGSTALFLGRRGKLEWLALAVPGFAVLASALLLIAGFRARSDISETTVTMQYVQTVPGTDDIIASGVNGVFTKSEKSSMALWGDAGGWAMPEMDGIEGATRRLIWSDIDRWSWEKLPVRPGLRTMVTQASGQVHESIRLTAYADFSGGRLHGQSGIPMGMAPSDAILVTPRGRLGLQINQSGEWSLLDQNDLSTGQYMAANVLSDEQQRRNQLLAEMLKFDAKRPNPPAPTLLVWTKPWQLSAFETPQSPPPLGGSALVAMPIHWQRPNPGSEFTIPNALLELREVTGPDGVRPSGFFDIRSNLWVERTGASTGWFALTVPEELLPLETRHVEVHMKVRGAMKRLELSCPGSGQIQSRQVWDDPVGTLTCSIDQGALMPIDQAGRLLFRLDVGLPEDRANSSGLPGNSNTQPSLLNGNDSGHDPAVYWRFEEIAAQVTVGVPELSKVTTATAFTHQ